MGSTPVIERKKAESYKKIKEEKIRLEELSGGGKVVEEKAKRATKEGEERSSTADEMFGKEKGKGSKGEEEKYGPINSNIVLKMSIANLNYNDEQGLSKQIMDYIKQTVAGNR